MVFIVGEKISELKQDNPQLWNKDIVRYWQNRFILDYGILIIGRVNRATKSKGFKYQVALIREMTCYTQKSLKALNLGRKQYKDKTILKLKIINKFPALYLLKTIICINR